MPISIFLRSTSRRAPSRIMSRFLLRTFTAVFLALCAAVCPAASIRGVVTDATGAGVTGAAVSLVSNGQVIASAFQDDLALMRVYMRLGCAIGRPLVKRPDGTDGLGDPFAAVKAPVRTVGAASASVSGSGKTATASTSAK